MTGIRKAAIALLSLEKALAAEVMAQLRDDEVKVLTMEIARLDDVTKEEQDSVVEELYNQGIARVHIERGGMLYARDLLTQSLGREKASAILDGIKKSLGSVPFGFLQNAGPENLLTLVVEEHPQTIALVLSHIPAGLAAQVLSGLPSAKQLEVVRRIATMEQTNLEVVQEVEKSLEDRMTSAFNRQVEKAGGVPSVAQMLTVTDRMTNKSILESLARENPELVEEIRRLMFVFDDLMHLDDKSMRMLLNEVEHSQWALALKGASEELKVKIMGNLSQRAAAMLQEEIQYLGPVRVSDVETAQQAIVDTVRRLEDAEEIVVGAGDAERMIA